MTADLAARYESLVGQLRAVVIQIHGAELFVPREDKKLIAAAEVLARELKRAANRNGK